MTKVIILAVIIFLGIAGLYFLFKGGKTSSAGVVSGTFNINGQIPSGASITLTQKKYNSSESPNVFASNVPVVDKGTWSFNTAESGKSYEIQAQVIVNGKTIMLSNPLDVSAPAKDEVLDINIESPQEDKTAEISGNVRVNGYIPSGSTITVQGRRLGEQEFTVVAENLKGQAQQTLSYTTAVSGASYEVQGMLLDPNGQTIGTSNLLTIVAPAKDESLVINSSAQAPTPSPTPPPPTAAPQSTKTPPAPTAIPVSISGNINFNGAVPSNSRIVIFQKPMNGSNYQVAVDNISPTDGVTWSWNSPQNSTWYTLIAILKQRQSNGSDKDISTSSPMTVAAPATNVTFTINSGLSYSPPSGQITVSCQTYNGGPNQNTWNVVVNFQSVDGAKSYWYQVGSSNGASDLINTANQSNGQNFQTVNATFNNNTTYYARYAYSNAAVAALNSGQYSGFSGTTALKCSH